MSKKYLAMALAATIMTVNGGAALAQGTTATSASDAPSGNDNDQGKWGLLGLVGLAGLFGLKRRDHRN